MGNPVFWRELAGDNPDELVLAIDFDATGRPDARFTDLVGNMGPGFTVWETVAQSMASEPGTDGQEYVARWAEEIRATGRRVGAVLGFCVGSVYATALADHVETWQSERPRTVFFDPEQASPLSMYWQYRKVIELMSPALSAAEVAEAEDAGQRAYEDAESLAGLGSELLEQFHRLGEVAFGRMGLDAERRAELSHTFTGFISYLSASADIDPVAGWRQGAAISSGTPTSGLNALRATAPGADKDAVAEEIRFATQHTELLRDPEVARAVSGLLLRAGV